VKCVFCCAVNVGTCICHVNLLDKIVCLVMTMHNTRHMNEVEGNYIIYVPSDTNSDGYF